VAADDLGHRGDEEQTGDAKNAERAEQPASGRTSAEGRARTWRLTLDRLQGFQCLYRTSDTHMNDPCCSHGCDTPPAARSPRYRRVLWAALVVNALMFGVELAGGLHAGSVSLLADAVDFFGDAANYGISLLVLGMEPAWRARAAMFKGLTMGAFGVFVLAKAAWSATTGTLPEPVTMGAIGVLALLANVGVAAMLYAWREGDANMRSVWLCSRNDAIGNLAVVGAALGVFGTGSAWPDLAVAAVMGTLALAASGSVVRQARTELRSASIGRAAPRAPSS
jgi:Co/Zn/Cd efflux system component